MRSVRIELILDTLKAIRGAKDLTKETDRVADSLGETAVSGEAAAKAVDDAGDNMSDAARAAKALDKQIHELTASLAGLAAAEALSGGKFTKQIREQESQVRRLAKTRKLLDGAGEEAAAGFSASFTKTVTPLFGRLGPALVGPLGASLGSAAVAAAPVLVGTLSVALSAGVGGGVIALGLQQAAADPQIMQRGQQIGAALTEGIQVKALNAFRGPLLVSLDALEGAATRTGDRIGTAFAALGPEVLPLVGRLIDASDQIGNALLRAAQSSGPALDALGDSIALLSTGITNVIDTLASGGPEAAADLRLVAGATADVLTQTVNFLAVLEKIGDNPWISGPLLALLKKHYSEAAGNAKELADKTARIEAANRAAAVATGMLVATQEDMVSAQGAVKDAQSAYNASLDNLNPKLAQATTLSDGLRKASQALYGAQISATEANEGYQASWDALSGSVKENKRSLDIHAASGRANRDALEALITSTNEAYFADIAAGTAIDAAKTKHDNRIKSIETEARKLGLDKKATQELITTYGQIPKDKTTNVLLTGITKIADTLFDLYIYQRSLAEGIPLASARAEVKGKAGPAKGGGSQFQGLSEGGYTGDGGKYEPMGVVHGGEWVLQKESTAKIRKQHPGLLEEMNATGQVQGYADGGLVPVEQRGLLYRTNVGVTKVPTKAQVAAKVIGSFTGGFGNWPSSPAAQRGDSGVWRKVVALIKSTGPLSGSFGNAYRPGDPLWHGSGRAVDWMGFNQDALATFLAARRPLELIHRSNKRDYAYTRGVNKGSFNNALMQAHRNHVHIAMQNGGMIREPVFGVGASGRSYSFAENGRPERVLSAAQTAAGRGAPVTVHAPITINGANHSIEQIATAVERRIGRTVDVYARGT